MNCYLVELVSESSINGVVDTQKIYKKVRAKTAERARELVMSFTCEYMIIRGKTYRNYVGDVYMKVGGANVR